MMLRPAVAGFTYAKLTPLLGWPGGLELGDTLHFALEVDSSRSELH